MFDVLKINGNVVDTRESRVARVQGTEGIA